MKFPYFVCTPFHQDIENLKSDEIEVLDLEFYTVIMYSLHEVDTENPDFKRIYWNQ